MGIANTIVRPIVTERSMQDVAKGRFTFEVARFAGKAEIKKAVEKHFKVNVIALATRVVKGKTHRVGVRRVEVTKTPWKKVTVTLKPGQKIDIFEIAK